MKFPRMRGKVTESVISVETEGDTTFFRNKNDGSTQKFTSCEELDYNDNGVKAFKAVDEEGREVFIAQEKDGMTVMERGDLIAIWKFILDKLPKSYITIENGQIKIKPSVMADIENRFKKLKIAIKNKATLETAAKVQQDFIALETYNLKLGEQQIKEKEANMTTKLEELTQENKRRIEAKMFKETQKANKLLASRVEAVIAENILPVRGYGQNLGG